MSATGFEIAITGLSIRCAGAGSAQEFWDLLMAGDDAIERFPGEAAELPAQLHALGAGADHVAAGAMLADPYRFDAEFFGFSAREAQSADPQQRHFIEVAWEAFANAGVVPGKERSTGVFAGASFPTYLLLQLWSSPDLGSVGQYPLTVGNDKDHIATRTAYALGLRGPAMTVQTACSTSMTAVHLACQSLLAAECDTALAGAGSLTFPQRRGYHCIEGGILSPDAHCRPFDERSSGTVPGDGVAAVVLRRLSDALRDGDPIRAVIRATALTNDSSGKLSYAAPTVQGQRAAIVEAQQLAGVTPSDISYVEAHGTATPLGDSVEVAALDQAMPRTEDPADRCLLGSVKSNIGHLDVAAGVAGLIKTVLALEHETIPATAHFTRPNPRLGLSGTRFEVVAAPQAWPRGERPRIAGLSSFGLGGTNVHVVVEEAPAREEAPAEPLDVPLLLSAGGETVLDAFADRLARWLDEHPATPLPQVAGTLASARVHRTHRRAIVADSAEQAVRRLRARPGRTAVAGRPRVAFLFPGAGKLPGSDLKQLVEWPAFQRAHQAVSAAVGRAGGRLLSPDEASEAPADVLEEPLTALPLLFATEVALGHLWRSWGVTPAAVLGHSVGECAAAVLAGVLTVDDAAALMLRRARLLTDAPGGGMAAVALDERAAAALAADFGLSVAAVNSADSCVLSGDSAGLARLLEHAAAQGIQARRLSVAAPAHSHLLTDAAAELSGFARSLTLNRPEDVRYVSGMAGRALSGDEVATPDYWGRQFREPVRFADALADLDTEVDLLLEVGPGGTLVPFARAASRLGHDRITGSLPHSSDPNPLRRHLLGTAGTLWEHGVPVDWSAVLGDASRRVALPSAPFGGTEHRVRNAASADGHRPEPAGGEPSATGARLYVPSWRRGLGSGRTGGSGASGKWLVVDDGSALAAEVAEALERRGALAEAVTWEQLQPVPGDPGAEGVERALSDRLPGDVAGALAFWSPTTPADSSPVQGRFHLAYAAARALGRADARERRLVLVGRGLAAVLGTETADPAAALAIGPVIVAGREYPSLRARVVDVETEPHPATAELVLAELDAGDDEELVALRGRHRWTRAWDAVAEHRTEDAARPAAGAVAGPFDDGTVLVTGGLGGIGIAVAQELVARGARSLVLVSRQGLPSESPAGDEARGTPQDAVRARAAGAIRAMTDAGARVLVRSADVTDGERLDAVVAEAARHLGPVTTVVHAAGVPGGGMMSTQGADAAAAVLGPKTVGTWHLARALRDHPVRRVLLCSALDAVLGTLGQAGHVAANAFLDAVPLTGWFGQAAVTAVNWGAWQEVGQAADTARSGALTAWRTQQLEHAITAAEGAGLAVRLLGSGHANVAVSAYDVTSLLRQARAADVVSLVEQQATGEANERRARPLDAATYRPPAGPLEETVAGIWSDVLGVQPVGTEDNYFALGGSSLSAMQLVARLRALFPFPIALTTVIERPTVAEQAAWLERETGNHIDSLSDEEVEERLSQLSVPAPNESLRTGPNHD